MAAVITTNFGAGSQGTNVPLNLKPWNYASTYRIVSDNGSLARMTDILAPLDKPTTIKVTVDKIANVYTTLASGSIPLAQQALNVTGQTTMIEMTTILTKTDGLIITQLPAVVRVIVRLPNDPDLTGTFVNDLVLATLAGMADAAGVNVLTSEKMRGALTPAGI